MTTLLWRSYVQYNLLQVGWRAFIKTVAMLAFSLLIAATATATLYQRAWEFVMPLEPRHGPASLNGSVRPKIRFSNSKAFVLLPDGRLWMETSNTNLWLGDSHQWHANNEPDTVWKIVAPFATAGVFVNGSNWTDLAGSYYGAIGVQSDGTLWKVFDWGSRRNEAAISELRKPTRIGADSNWQSITSGNGYYLALKNDGTIWGYGTNSLGGLGTNPGKDTNDWVRVGNDSDWVKVFASDNTSFAIKRDGSVWKWGDDWETRKNRNYYRLEKIPHASPRRCEFSGTNWVSIHELTDWHSLALLNNGTMRLGENGGPGIPRNVLGGYVPAQDGAYVGGLPLHEPPERTFADVRGNSVLVGLTITGSILESSIHYWTENPVRQPSKYNDWIAVEYCQSGVFTGLAADGTLCFWRDPNWQEWNLLGPSRKAVWSVNILANAK